MYESYWNLERKPFENASDPAFYYPCESHQGALLKLRYAIENQRGAAVLAGPSGVGKTLLINLLKRQLGEAFSPFAHLVFPQMPTPDLLAYLAEELGAPRAEPPSRSLEESVLRIQRVLAENARTGRHAVIVVDEAHLLEGTRPLETLRLLLNFEHEGRSSLTLVLVGQPSLLPALDRMPQLEERLGAKCLLRCMKLEETISYVHHRLKAAGARQTIFDAAALDAVHNLTQGNPRRVNRLCDLALLIGYAEELPVIHAGQLESISQELVTVAPD